MALENWYDQLSGSYADRVREAANRLDRATDDGTVATDDRDRIHALAEYEAIGEGKANTTMQNRIQALYLTAKRGDRPLAEHSAESLAGLLRSFQTGRHPDVKEGGIGTRNYEKALRVFYRFHDDLSVDPEEIELSENSSKDLQPEDILYRDEVDAMFSQTRDIRDRALFALLLATGQRNDAVRTLRMKHVDRGERTITINLNDAEGATKGASGPVALLWAKHYVRTWVDDHPYANDPEAALFPPAKGAVPEDKRREPMKTDAVTKAVKRMADRAGVEKPRYGVTPHILRATAITRLVAKGVSEQRIKGMVGWNRDSSQFETYTALAQEIDVDAARRELGYSTENDEPPAIGRPTLETCPGTGCGEPIPAGRDVCPTCGFDLSAPSDSESPTPDTDTREMAKDGLLAAFAARLDDDVTVEELLENAEQNIREGQITPDDIYADEE